MFGVWLPVLVPGAGRASDRQEQRVVQRLVRRATRYGKNKREMRPLRGAVGARPEWLLHQRWRGSYPELAVGRIGNNVKQRQVLGGRVVNPVSGPDAGLARAA